MERPLNIMLVDNEAEFLDAITYWLETKEHRVQVCYTGPDALEAIKKDPPDIIFLDIYMPDMDGLEVLKKIREFNSTIPVIIITGYPKEDKMHEALSMGAAGFFPKTINFEELGRIIKAAVRTHKDLHHS
ncbi:MAG: response regulator [Candidatus Omnitrophota bacterium]